MLKKIAVFVVALFIGIAAAAFWKGQDRVTAVIQSPPAPLEARTITDIDTASPVNLTAPRPGTCALKILSKPQPAYTEAAERENTQGKVVLKVIFLASGRIGNVSPVSVLPNGLTERAILAARGITFEPATRDGVAYSVSKTVEYSFSIY